jgi:uncharacterized protein (UPF0548 family)
MTGTGALRVGRLGPTTSERLLARARGADVTYPHVGSTSPSASMGGGTTSASGRRVRTHRLALGRGSAPFSAAIEGLRAWVEHAGIHARVVPVRPPIEVGTSLLVILGVGPVHLAVPDRIVAVIDEPNRFGFAYGTLPGHPERGEESFVIDRAADDQVTLTIRIDAVPAWPVLRPLTPVLDWLQDQAARRYLRAIADHVENSAAPTDRTRR